MTMRKKNFKSITGKRYDGMIGRCYRKTDVSYKSYGEAGIKVCSEWIHSIEYFRSWVANELKNMNVTIEEFEKNPSNFTLDRIDPNGHYTPFNCRLVPQQTQSRNKKKRIKQMYISAEGEKIYA